MAFAGWLAVCLWLACDFACKLKSLLLLGLSKLSRRAHASLRSIFLGHINRGGLFLLNELVIDASGSELAKVLHIVTDAAEAQQPIAWYCTAGKDRTGLIAMLILHVLGASEQSILEDYALSDNAYQDLNDHQAMVASLEQADVDPKTFLRAQPAVMAHAMAYFARSYGSINAYLDEYGFTALHRQRLRDALLRRLGPQEAT
jgi:hypothetical protein